MPLRIRFILMGLVLPGLSLAQAIDSSYYQELQWRCIGPYRGGRTVGVAGIPTEPNVFYIGVNNGGVWKTTDFGQTWNPVFDEEPTGSIGAIAIAPSDPKTIYVGSGEGLQRPDLSVGDGIYKSVGKTWKHLGLGDAQQISSIIVDPKNPDRIFVAALGHPYGANEERGVFRSLDGGQTWAKVLYKDPDTGAVALSFAPDDSNVVYADLWAARQAPWENGAFEGPHNGLFRSLDGGSTWEPIGKGIPPHPGRIGFAVSPSAPKHLYALVDAPQDGGLYESFDRGDSWQILNKDRRIWGRGSDFAEVRVNPQNDKIVYVANTSTYKSIDGGFQFHSWKGAPGGDDYHTIWLNPLNPEIICLASDQGATISVNGGDTWSSWYNQPTAQFYHVITDNQVPYNVYGAQQESGSIGISSRGNDGEITFREWHPVGAEEYGYIAPDPLNPNTIFGGKLSRWDKATGQVQDVSPAARRGSEYRFLRTAPLVFSPVDPRCLFYAGNVVFKTLNGGNSWQVISPDLSREHPKVPESVGVYREQAVKTLHRRGVIYSLAPSPLDVKTLWAGTDDGLVHLTRDGGKSWSNVTPSSLTDWSKVSVIDAGHFDRNTAYCAINRIRLDDQTPHIWRTHDGGKTWTPIVNGLPLDAPVNSVKEDPQKKGLLFCGTEHSVYFSLDDGDHWNSLRQNMPATSIRDLVVHENDLVVGTHGRSFWILDDITALRQLEPLSPKTTLFKPADTYRFRRDTNSDTPLPPEFPAGKNPADGVVLDYYLSSDSPVRIQIFDSSDHVVREYSSSDEVVSLKEHNLEVPYYWVRPLQLPSSRKGMHRFVWDMYWQPLQPGSGLPISAVPGDTPPNTAAPLAAPGRYKVQFQAGQVVKRQEFTLKADPRIKNTEAPFQAFEMAKRCYDRAMLLRVTYSPEAKALYQAYLSLMTNADAADAAPTKTLLNQLQELESRFHQLVSAETPPPHPKPR